MPNWCDTHYTIKCNKETKKAILNAIRKIEICDEEKGLKEKEFEELKNQGLSVEEIYQKFRQGGNYFRNDVWLYYVLLELGYSKEFLDNYHKNMRGYITDYDEGEDDISIYCDTAWTESAGFRHLLLDKFHDDDPDMKIYYTAEESGCGYFLTNDPDYDGTYVVDIENDEITYADEDSLVGIVNDYLGTSCSTVEEVLNTVNKHNVKTKDKDYIWIHVFEFYED